jgi:hypothetical protein
MTAEEICKALYHAKYRYHNEKELQRGVFELLTGLGLEFQPEVVLNPRDRIDFLVGTIGIECKSDDSSGGTSLASVTRQLMRYAYCPEVTELILLTTMSKHRNLPNEMNGKPLYVVHLLLSFL